MLKPGGSFGLGTWVWHFSRTDTDRPAALDWVGAGTPFFFVTYVSGRLAIGGPRVPRAKALTALLLVSLGLGTGVNAAVFGVVDALLFRAPEGIAGASRLATVCTSQYDGRAFGPSSWPDYMSVAGLAASLESIAAVDDRSSGNVRVGEHTQLTRIAAVTDDSSSTLGKTPRLGRLLQAGDSTAALAPAVISLAVWDAAGRPDITALTITVLGRDHMIVGVAPPGFRGLQAGRMSDVWIPLPQQSAERGRGDRRLTLIGRMRHGATIAQADGELERLSEALARQFPSTNRGAQAQPKKRAGSRRSSTRHCNMRPGRRHP